MKKFFVLILLIGSLFLSANAQNGSVKWDLQQCVQWAVENNISVKQADIQARIAALQAKQAKYNLLPNISGNSSAGVRFGRSIDPTTNVFATSQFLYQNFGVNAGVQLFNNGRLQHALSAANLNAMAAQTDVKRIANDVSLNVANFYLQAISANEQVNITSVQIEQTKNQYSITKKRVEAGVLPELNLVEVEAQLATDSSNYYAARGIFEQSMLNLRALLNLPVDTEFGIVSPDANKIPLLSIGEMHPEEVYQMALNNQPQQKVDSLRIKAAIKNLQVAKAQLYPTITLGGNLSTNFSNSFKKTVGGAFLGYSPITGSEPVVNIGNSNYYLQYPLYKVTQTSRSFSDLWSGWNKQLDNNFGQNVGLNISIPIFNNGQARNAQEQAKLNLRSSELQKSQNDLSLKQNIYIAYTNAVTALQKFNAGIKTVEATQKAYSFALKRFEVGLLSSIDLIITQNNYQRAKIQQLNNQYDYIFKMKVLEFYKGNGIKL